MIKRFTTLFSAFYLISMAIYAQAPTGQASGIIISPISGSTTSMRLEWTNGNGSGRMVVIKNAFGNFTPTNGAIPGGTISNDLSAATDQDASTGGVAKVVYNGTAATIDVLGLAPNTPYFIQVYEWNTNVPNPTYSTVTNTTNPISFRYYITSSSYLSPIDVTTLNIQVWGAGGGGGNSNNTGGEGGGGGGGGAYSTTPSYAVTTNTSYTVTVGGGGAGAPASSTTNAQPGDDSWFNSDDAAGVVARGGSRGLDNAAIGSGGGAGGTTGGHGTTKRAGGNGAPTQDDGNGQYGGGGGTSAGINAGGNSGNTNSNGNMATAPLGGGNGGGAGSGGNTGNGGNGGFPGGGGGGSDDAAVRFGGNGADGLVIVSFNDNTAPTASFVRQPATTNPYTNATSVIYRVTFNEVVNNVSADGSDFAVGVSGSAAITAISVAANSELQYDVTVTGITGEGDLNLNFGTTDIRDISNNAVNTTPTIDEIYIRDITSPTTSQVGTVISKGGNEVAPYWNTTNTTLEVVVPLTGADASMIGGTIQVQIQNTTNVGYVSIAGSGLYTITGTDVTNQTATVVINAANLIAATGGGSTGYLNNANHNIRALVKDVVASNPAATYTASTTVLSIDTTPPTTPGVPDLLSGSDSGISQTDNITNDNTPTFEVASVSEQRLEILEGSTIIAFTNSATATQQLTPASSLTDNASYSITARVYDLAGNSASSTAMSPVLNIDTGSPTAPGTPNMTNGTDLGLTNSDNITSDNTPNFDGSATTGDFIVINSNVNGNSTSVTAASGNYNGLVARFAKTGTITATTGGTGVTGVGTLFSTELSVGQRIYNAAGASIGVIALIPTNTSLTLTANGSVAVSGAGYSVGFSDGAHTISAIASDVAGNTTSSASTLNITIDTEIPVLTSLVPIATPTRGIITLSGTITTGTGSATVNGTGTSFMTELFVGAIIRSYTDQAIGTVLSIASNTQLTLAANASTALTNGAYGKQLYWTATFDNPVNSSTITTNDFSETGNGTRGTVVPATAGTSSTVFYIHDNTFGQTGSSRIDLTNDGYSDIAGNSSSATLTGGSATLDNANPTVSSIVRKTPTDAYTHATTVTYTVTFSEDVAGVDDLDFAKTITGGGFTAGAITVTPVSASEYDVEIASIAAVDGTLRLDVIGGASILDNAGNRFTTAFTSGEVYTFDYSAPSAFTTGSVVSTGGRVRPYYYNLTNTGIDVTVPIGNDASLNGGTVQIRARLLPAGSFANVGSASTITAVGIGVTKVVSLSSTDLTGYLADGSNIEFTAVITDLAGNTPTTGTASTIQITVDLVRPTITVSPRVYDNKGGGPSNGGGTNNHEVIQFTVNEELYNDATAGTITCATNSTTVTGVGTNFTKLVIGGVITNASNAVIGTIQSITSDISLTLTSNASVAVTGGAFKFRGLLSLLGLTTSAAGTIGSSQYINSGTANTVDGTLANTRLIYIESTADNSSWNTSTNLIYSQSSGGSAAGNYLYDAAGNEMNSFNITCTSGDITPPTVNPDVMTLYPRAGNPEKIVFTLSEALSTSTTSNAVTGFSTTGSYPDATIANATYSEASPGVCPCTITLTSATNGAWAFPGTTVSYSQASGNVLDLAGVPNELGNITNHVLVVETTPPSITAVSIPDAAMRVGSVVTATITTDNDDGDDVIYTSGTIGGFNLTGATIVNTTPASKTIQFTVLEGGTDVAAGATIPVTNIILSDGQGNASTPFSATITQANDPIDAHSPTISSITNLQTVIYEGGLVQRVTVVYNEAMSTAFQPTISVSTGNTHWTQAPFGGTNGWVGATYTATLTHDTFEEELGSATTSVAVGGARDAAGNPNLGTLSSTGSPFIIDTKKPTVTVGVSPSTINVTNHTITVTVDYNEEMNTTIDPTIAFTIGTGVSNFNATGAGVWSNGDKRYVRSYQQLNNLTSLTNSVTVTNGRDDAGNTQLSAGSGNFVIDTQRPTVVSVNRVGSQFTNATTVYYTVTFSEAVSNLALSDFTPFIVLNNPSVNAGDVVGMATTDNITYTIEVENVGGNGNIRLDVNTSGAITDARGNTLNTGFTGGQIYTVDNIPATIQSIVISSPVNTWSNANGLPINLNDSASFNVTFTEPVTGVDASDFSITNNIPTNLTIGGPVIVTGSGTSWTVKIKGLNLSPTGSGSQFKIDLIDDNSILDLAGLPLGGSTLGDGNSVTSTLPTTVTGATDYYTAALPEPVDIATGYTLTGTTPNSFTFQFTNPLTPAKRITHYIIQLRRSNATFPNPVEGSFPLGANDTNFSDGNLSRLISAPAPGSVVTTNTTSFTGGVGNLTSGFDYFIRIISVSYSGLFNTQQQLDYLMAPTLNGMGNTTTATAGTVSSVSSSGTISSLITAGNGVPVYTFTLNDDGTTAPSKALDNAPTKFNTLVIKKGATNNVADWSTTIAGAQLTDLDGNVITGADVDINASDITFSNIPSLNNTQLGYIDDDENKQYTLRVWLTDPLVVADNSRLDFRVDNTSFPLYDNTSNSQVSSKFTTTAAESGTVQIDVKATKLVFITNPQPTIGVGVNFSESSLAEPRIEARDANDNLDTDYNASFNVTPSTGVVTTHTNFGSGVLTLETFNFSTAGSRTITISGNVVTGPIAYPALTGAGVHAVSTSVNAIISNKTTISEATLPGSERNFIPSTTNTIPAFFNFDFTITDDVGVDGTDYTDNDALPTIVQTITITRGGNNGTNATPGPDDDATTFDEWTRVIAGAQLKAVGNTQTVTGVVSNGSISFNIPAGSFMETVPNDGVQTYELRIWLRNPIDIDVRDILDNKDFVFAINQSNIGIGSANTTSTLANSSASTGDGRNVVTVTSTRLVFTKQPATSQSYDAPITPYPVVRALDPNGNLDKGYTGTPTLTTTPNGSITYPILAGTAALINTGGKITFDSVAAGGVLTVTSGGGGLHGDQTRFVVSGGLNDQGFPITAASSILFTMNYSGNSNIIRDGSFTHPTDIQSINNREAVNLTAANSIPLDRFILQDGGVSNDADGTKTKLQSITLNLTNHTNIRRIGLYDENNVEIKELDSTAFTAGGNITFTSFASAFEADDDDRTTKRLTVRASFRATVSDNQQINVSVVSASASSSSSQLVPVSIPGDNLGTDKNKIEVMATRLIFTNPSTPTNASLFVNYTPGGLPVRVEARDAFQNLDVDFSGSNSTVRILSNATGATMTGGPTIGSSQFLNGVLTFVTPLQFTSGNNDDNVSLTLTAGDNGACNGTTIICGTTALITLKTSFESSFRGDPTFVTPSRIAYLPYQENTNLTAGNSYELTRALLVDGSRGATYIYNNGSTSAALNTNTNSGDALPDSDNDGAPTNLTSLTLRIYKPSAIRRIALYSGNTEIASTEIDIATDIPSITAATVYHDFTWTSASLLQAGDDGQVPLSVRVSFKNTSPEINDLDDMQVQLMNAVVGTGSQFFVGAGYIAGQPAASGPGSFGRINVVATSLDFVNQPSDYAGIQQPLNGTVFQGYTYATGIVHARDAHALLDTEFNNTYTVTTPASGAQIEPTSIPSSFANGVLNFSNIRYTSAGPGKLTVAANSLNSNNIPFGTSRQCEQVDVINVNAVLNSVGVLTTPSLKGGNIEQTIFGFTFQPQHYTATEPSLRSFSITFKDDNGDPYFYKKIGTTVLKNFKIRESTQGSVGNSTNITGSVTITEGTSPTALSLGAAPTSLDMITVTFTNPADYRSLFDPANPRTYYLQVDVDVTTNVGTPRITPYLENNGYSDALTRDNVVLTVGSALIAPPVVGLPRSFASTKPPALTLSNPFRGQLNVDPTQDTIYLTFDVPVTTFDGKIELYDRSSGALYATLNAANGVYQWSTGQPISPSPYVTSTLKFVMPLGVNLIPDSVYFVKIAPGSFNPNNPTQRAGISDDGFNLFGGLSFSGGLYFKASSPNAPKMTGTNSFKYAFSSTTATINASFNQRGKAYFMITNMGAASPTNAQINGTNMTYSGTVYGRGSFKIDNIEPDYQFGTVNASLNVGTSYDVWIYAENDALPTPIATASHYGSSSNSFAAGAAGPTLRITPSSTPPVTVFSLHNSPNYQVCANSFTKLTDPIILAEQTNQQFTTSGSQSLNIILPTGFQFDVSTLPTVKYSGSDFVGSVTPSFFNTTILTITFNNHGLTNSLDNIIISDLVVTANAANLTGTIRRFGGSAIPAIPDTSPGNALGQITSVADQPIDFSNSYSNIGNFDQVPISINSTVTYIPDNYADATLNALAVRLFPSAPRGDYGDNAFSGSGVTDDILSLTAVQVNSGFNILLTHTDMNGCVSTKSNQYTIYDHKNAIPQLGSLSAQNERQICITNNNFPNPSTTLMALDSVPYNGRAGFQLLRLFANIPAKATYYDTLNSTHQPSDQILYGSAWQNLVKQIPVIIRETKPAQGDSIRDYRWNYNPVLNATGTGLMNPYKYFIEPNRTPIRNAVVYKGGSLGIVEFTGKYQSTADYSVVVPIRQEVEVFIPARPIVEAGGQSAIVGDTLIYCQDGSSITLFGYPLATAGSSTGFFTLRDAENPSTIVATSSPTSGFTDNANGTATLNPNMIQNSYRTIRVDYTYQENGSPCSGTGSYYIRITPNPQASFIAKSVLASANPIQVGRPSSEDAYCVGNLIQFDNTSTFNPGPEPYLANRNPRWTMGVPSSGTNIQLNDSALFTYNTFGKYDVAFSVESQYGCPSEVVTAPIYIGVIPTPNFKLNGISTNTPVNVRSTTSISSGTTFPRSDTLRSEWNFNSGTTDPELLSYSTNNKFTYTTPGHYTITLKATSEIRPLTINDPPQPGCEISYQRQVIIVPHIEVTLLQKQVTDDFESDDAMDQWQSASANSSLSTWERGVPTETSSRDLVLAPHLSNNKVWATNLVGPYNPGEVSYLYSPSYDIEALTRPKVGFDQVAYMGVNDGVAFEFSMDTFNIADPLKKWYRLGTNDNGNNWYNKPGLASTPGDQTDYATQISAGDFGWSSQLDTVMHSQHTLSPDIPASKRKHVIFRFAMASMAGSQNEGFAFDNFRVGERSRLVLIENFTNLGNPPVGGVKVEKDENNFLNGTTFQGVGRDVVKLNYHVAFPGLDPLNDDYPADPSARALFYNISETPMARMDGHSSPNPQHNQSTYFSRWGAETYNIRTLQLAEADIDITTTPLPDGSFDVVVHVTAIDDLPQSTILHVAFLEDSVFTLSSQADWDLIKTEETSFEYVVKKMLPSALGTRFTSPLLKGLTREFTEDLHWMPESSKLYDGEDDLSIVAFLQDEVTKNIYQAHIESIGQDPSIITGVEDPDYASRVNIYPNPASDEVNIVLPAPANKQLPMIMADAFGRIIHEGNFNTGEQSKTLKTSELTGGVYFIQITTPEGNFVRRKVMVIHR